MRIPYEEHVQGIRGAALMGIGGEAFAASVGLPVDDRRRLIQCWLGNA
jgi:hypothetical protein